MRSTFRHDEVAITVRADTKPVGFTVRVGRCAMIYEFAEVVVAADHITIYRKLGDDCDAVVFARACVSRCSRG